MSNRGLHNFLTEVYSGATKVQSDYRIKVELAKIKKAFLSPKLSSYNRKKYISKLCFIVLSGCHVCFGLPQILDLIESKKVSMQRIGWMAAVIVCGNDSDQVSELIPAIKRHLTDIKNENGINFTLCALASIGGQELAESVGPIIAEIALSKATHADYTRKKALLALTCLYRSSQLPLVDSIVSQLTSLLCDPSYGIRLSVCHLIHTIQIFQPSSVYGVFASVLDILNSFFVKSEYDHEFSTSDIPCSILSARMFQILSFKTNWTDSDVESFEKITVNILNRFAIKREEDGLISYFSVFAEIVFLALAVPVSDAILEPIAQILFENIKSQILPIRYFCLDNLSTLIQAFPRLATFARPSLPSLFEMMKTNDPELNINSMQLLYVSANKDNGLDILSEFVDYIQRAPLYMRDILLQKSAVLTQSYAFDERWCIDTLVYIICSCSNDNGSVIWKSIIQSIAGKEEIQVYLIHKLFLMITEFKMLFTDQFKRLVAYIFGEYAVLITEDVELIIARLKEFFDNSSSLCKSMIITCFFKISLKHKQYREKLVKFMEEQKSSLHTDVSQRCNEYLQLLNFPESTLHHILTASRATGFAPKISDIAPPGKNHPPEIDSENVLAEDEDVNLRFLNSNQGDIYVGKECCVSVSLCIYPPNAKVTILIKTINGPITIKNLSISSDDALKYRIVNFENKNADDSIEIQNEQEITVEFVAIDIFNFLPILKIDTNLSQISANIPLLFPRWMQEMAMDRNTFFSRWNAINDNNNLVSISLVIPDGNVMNAVIESAKVVFGLQPLNIELPENNVVMCGVFKCLNKSIGILLRFVFNEADNDLSLIIKSTSPIAIEILKKRAYGAFLL